MKTLQEIDNAIRILYTDVKNNNIDKEAFKKRRHELLSMRDELTEQVKIEDLKKQIDLYNSLIPVADRVAEVLNSNLNVKMFLAAGGYTVAFKKVLSQIELPAKTYLAFDLYNRSINCKIDCKDLNQTLYVSRTLQSATTESTLYSHNYEPYNFSKVLQARKDYNSKLKEYLELQKQIDILYTEAKGYLTNQKRYELF